MTVNAHSSLLVKFFITLLFFVCHNVPPISTILLFLGRVPTVFPNQVLASHNSHKWNMLNSFRAMKCVKQDEKPCEDGKDKPRP